MILIILNPYFWFINEIEMIVNALEIVHKISIKLLIVNFGFRIQSNNGLFVNGITVENKTMMKCTNDPNQPKIIPKFGFD